MFVLFYVLAICAMFALCNVCIVQCLCCAMFVLCNVCIVQCLCCAMFVLCNVCIVQCLRCAMFALCNVSIVQCFCCGMIVLCNVCIVQCLYCAMLRSMHLTEWFFISTGFRLQSRGGGCIRCYDWRLVCRCTGTQQYSNLCSCLCKLNLSN